LNNDGSAKYNSEFIKIFSVCLLFAQYLYSFINRDLLSTFTYTEPLIIKRFCLDNIKLFLLSRACIPDNYTYHLVSSKIYLILINIFVINNDAVIDSIPGIKN